MKTNVCSKWCARFSKPIFFVYRTFMHQSPNPSVCQTKLVMHQSFPLRIVGVCWNMIMEMTLSCEAFNDYTHIHTAVPHKSQQRGKLYGPMLPQIQWGQNGIGVYNQTPLFVPFMLQTAHKHTHLQSRTVAFCPNNRPRIEIRVWQHWRTKTLQKTLKQNHVWFFPLSLFQTLVIMKEHHRQRVT